MLGIAVHHTVYPAVDHPFCASQVAAIRSQHLSTGYSDIAYNWLVCQHGQQYAGRGWARPSGANGTTYANLNYWAIAWMGDGTRETPTPAAEAACSALIADAMRRGTPEVVRPHSTFYATACPSDWWRAWIDRQGWKQGADDMTADELRQIVREEITRQAFYDAAHVTGEVTKLREWFRPLVDRLNRYLKREGIER